MVVSITASPPTPLRLHYEVGSVEGEVAIPPGTPPGVGYHGRGFGL
jgi:hypothetical protein